MSYKVILASASPRRREILEAAGIAFEVRASKVEERRMDGESPEQYVCRLAVEKAEAVAREWTGARLPRTFPIVGADTEVVVDGRVLGKPESDEHAVEMLGMLSGRTHRVITGLCVLDSAGRRLVETVTTAVTFAALSDAEIRDYVASGEPRDKAGAYGIQGLAAKFVERIDGCYFNVMGLPVATLYGMLKRLEESG